MHAGLAALHSLRMMPFASLIEADWPEPDENGDGDGDGDGLEGERNVHVSCRSIVNDGDGERGGLAVLESGPVQVELEQQGVEVVVVVGLGVGHRARMR